MTTLNILKFSTILFSLALTDGYAQQVTQNQVTENQSKKFELREMDFHVHSGMERDVTLEKWVDISAKDGRKVMLLLDHLELYREQPGDHQAWIQENTLTDWFPVGAEGQISFMNSVLNLHRPDLLIYRGWEIWEGELDGKLERGPMKMAQAIGWHSSPADGEIPCGKKLIKRCKQIIEIQKEFQIPMVVFHPFSSRIGAVQKNAQKEGRSISSISTEEYRFFKPGEQEELIELLKGKSIFLEVGNGISSYWQDAKIRAAVIQDIKPLTDAGVHFIVSSDAHHLKDLSKPFNPELYCKDLGITKENANFMVDELIRLNKQDDQLVKNQLTDQISFEIADNHVNKNQNTARLSTVDSISKKEAAKNASEAAIPLNALKGDFDGDGQPEYAWLVTPKLSDDGMSCVGDCISILKFSDPKIPSIEVPDCISGEPVNLGDLNGNRIDEIGLLPGWFSSCWNDFLVWTLSKGQWIPAVDPIPTHCNQWDQGIKPIEIDPKIKGNVIIHYSIHTGTEILIQSKSVKIVR